MSAGRIQYVSRRIRAVLRVGGPRRRRVADAAGRVSSCRRTRACGHLDAIERELMVDGLVSRYDSAAGVDGLPPGEGAFLACSFWFADNLVCWAAARRRARFRAAPVVAQRCRLAVGRIRRREKPARQFSAGVFAHRADQYRAYLLRTGQASPGKRHETDGAVQVGDNDVGWKVAAVIAPDARQGRPTGRRGRAPTTGSSRANGPGTATTLLPRLIAEAAPRTLKPGNRRHQIILARGQNGKRVSCAS